MMMQKPNGEIKMVDKKTNEHISKKAIEFADYCSRFNLDFDYSYYWIPIRRIQTTKYAFVVMPNELTCLTPNVSIQNVLVQSLKNTEKILSLFTDLCPVRDLSIRDYYQSTLRLSFEIPDNNNPVDYGHELRNRIPDVLTSCEPDIISEADHTYTITFLI